MNGRAVIRASLEQSKNWILGLIDDIKDAPTTMPTTAGGNHPLWVLGHLVYSEAEIRQSFILGESNPLGDLAELFGMGSQPQQDASKYPPVEELLARFEAVRADTLKLLDSLTDEDLDKPSHAPQEVQSLFGTVGQCLVMMALHIAFHGGQVADARRAAGRGPLNG